MNIEILQQIFELCIVPLLGIITKCIVDFINNKNAEINANIDNDMLFKYNNMLTETIRDCVIATNQTYVNSLKGKHAFNLDAQKEAFNQTYDKVMSVITEDAKQQLASAYGDLNVYITTKIEAEVNLNKEENHE